MIKKYLKQLAALLLLGMFVLSCQENTALEEDN